MSRSYHWSSNRFLNQSSTRKKEVSKSCFFQINIFCDRRKPYHGKCHEFTDQTIETNHTIQQRKHSKGSFTNKSRSFNCWDMARRESTDALYFLLAQIFSWKGYCWHWMPASFANFEVVMCAIRLTYLDLSILGIQTNTYRDCASAHQLGQRSVKIT